MVVTRCFARANRPSNVSRMPDSTNSQPPSANRPQATESPAAPPASIATTVTPLGEIPLASTSRHSGRTIQLK